MHFSAYFPIFFATTLALPQAPPPPPSCPAALSFPRSAHTIAPSHVVLISKNHPSSPTIHAADRAANTHEWVAINPSDICALFTLHLPDYAGNKTCQLSLYLPPFPDASADPSGPPAEEFVANATTGEHVGYFSFTGFAVNTGAVPGNTTFATLPAAGPSPPRPPYEVRPGNKYVVHEGPCGVPEGNAGGWDVSGMLCSEDTVAVWRQTGVAGRVEPAGACPRGFFVSILDG